MSIRIVGGSLKGRVISTLKTTRVRPTQNKHREAIFNILAPWLDWERSHVLDLFAGTGALGFEALSRGARKVTFCEKDRGQAARIRGAAKELGVENKCCVLLKDVRSLQFSANDDEGEFDLIFADPPYDRAWGLKTLQCIHERSWLSKGGVAVLETSSKEGEEIANSSLLTSLAPTLVNVKCKPYGDTQLWFFKRSE